MHPVSFFATIYSIMAGYQISSYSIPSTINPERRGKPRVNCSFPAIVNGKSIEGMKFETPAVLANMSASGMYLRIKRHIPLGDALFITVRLSTAPLDKSPSPHIAALGQVVRVETQPDGAYGVALKLHDYRFL